MFRRIGFRTLMAITLLLFTAMFADTHSGRTDKYGGHHDRKNGGYHYHNSGTVSRPRSTTPRPRSTTLQQGKDPYIPTKLEWLALDLNAGIPISSIKYYTTTKANTISVCVFYNPTMTVKQRQELMNFGKQAIRKEANGRGWTWLKLEEKYQEL